VYQDHLHSVLLECKQVTCKDKENGRLTFKRLKQMHDMLCFSLFSKYTKAYFIIGYLESRITNSEIYLVPADELKKYMDSVTKKSINRSEFNKYFSHRILLNYDIYKTITERI
jgi:hypothetical protein